MADKLIRPKMGKTTAKCIPNAQLKLFDNMGHDIPLQLTPQLSQLLADHAGVNQSTTA